MDFQGLVEVANRHHAKIIEGFVADGIDFKDIGNDSKVVIYINPLMDRTKACVSLQTTLMNHGIVV